jgi:hypothetical protein
MASARRVLHCINEHHAPSSFATSLCVAGSACWIDTVRCKEEAMTPVVERKHIRVPHESRRPQGRKADVDQEHDLPVLAIETNPRVQLPWQALMEDGVVPALILGAERRSSGRR